MPRLNVVDPAHAAPAAKAIFDGPLKGKHFNIFKGLANSPAALQAYLSLSGALGGGMLTAQERELIALCVGQANNCGYCLAAHTAIGAGAGLTPDQIIAARRGGSQDAKHDALVKFTLAVHEKRGFVSEADLAAFRKAGYADGHVAEVVACYALNVFTNTFNHVNDTAVDFPAAPVL
ncbi:MAG: hypothetical protein RL689_2465 [Planctomycetota bacterium]|jgi:uncharacterized peroxidase-related enzyme